MTGLTKLLEAIPACPVHGPYCVHHALRWIEVAKDGLIELKGMRAFHRTIWKSASNGRMGTATKRRTILVSQRKRR